MVTTKHESEETLEDDVATAQSDDVEHPESEQEISQQDAKADRNDGDSGI